MHFKILRGITHAVFRPWLVRFTHVISCRIFSSLYKLEVRHIRRGHRPNEFEAAQIVPDTVEQPGAAAEERRHEIDLHLVHEAGGEILLRRARAAGEGYIFTTCGAYRKFQGCLYSLGDEGEGRSSFKFEWFTRVSREHEHRVMERRINSPPAVPWIPGVPWAGPSAKHVSPHHRGPDVGQRFLYDRCAFVDFPAF